jgi:hypothetical protein
MATTFRSSSPDPITQSMPFLSAPGRLNAYSGDAMRTASLSARACLHRRTPSGTPVDSRSASKCGRSRRPSKITTRTPGGADASAAFRRARFFEFACRLPQTARILMSQPW